MRTQHNGVYSRITLLIILILAALTFAASFLPIFSIELTSETPRAKAYAESMGEDRLDLSVQDLSALVFNYQYFYRETDAASMSSIFDMFNIVIEPFVDFEQDDTEYAELSQQEPFKRAECFYIYSQEISNALANRYIFIGLLFGWLLTGLMLCIPFVCVIVCLFGFIKKIIQVSKSMKKAEKALIKSEELYSAPDFAVSLLLLSIVINSVLCGGTIGFGYGSLIIISCFVLLAFISGVSQMLLNENKPPRRLAKMIYNAVSIVFSGAAVICFSKTDVLSKVGDSYMKLQTIYGVTNNLGISSDEITKELLKAMLGVLLAIAIFAISSYLICMGFAMLVQRLKDKTTQNGKVFSENAGPMNIFNTVMLVCLCLIPILFCQTDIFNIEAELDSNLIVTIFIALVLTVSSYFYKLLIPSCVPCSESQQYEKNEESFTAEADEAQKKGSSTVQESKTDTGLNETSNHNK